MGGVSGKLKIGVRQGALSITFGQKITCIKKRNLKKGVGLSIWKLFTGVFIEELKRVIVLGAVKGAKGSGVGLHWEIDSIHFRRL